MKEVAGCGIDTEDLNRFRTKIPFPENSKIFSEMVFSGAEISRNLETDPRLAFPLGFSCKESVFKAFGVSWTNSRISWKDVELIFNSTGNLKDYTIRLSGYAEELYREMKCCAIESDFEIRDHEVIFQVILLS